MSDVDGQNSRDAGPDQLTVLHVDDDTAFGDLAADALEREDDSMAVISETRASDGLDRLKAEPVDCIVSDYVMPKTDGLQFLDAVRDDYPDLPFILFTGKGSEEIASEAISMGVTDYLQKDTGTDQYTVLANRVRNAVEKTRAERRLRKHRSQFRSLFDSLPEPTVAVTFEDDGAVLQRVNRAFEETFGYDGTAPGDRLLEDLIVPDEERAGAMAINERVQRGEVVDRAVRREAVDGQRDFLFRSIPLASDAEFDGFGVYIDVTERKERERQSETRAAAMEASIDGIAILDEDGEYVFVNQAHADIYGYDDVDAFMGNTWEMCYSDDELDRMGAEVLPVLHEEGSWRGEGVGVREDGSTFPQELSLSIMDSGAHVCVVRDISERTEREAELRETNRLLQSFLDTTPAAVFVKDRDGRYELTNDGCRDLFGFADDVVGRTDHELFPEDVADRFRADDRRVYEAGEAIEVEENVPTADGTQTFLTLKSPIYDDSGEMTGLCGVSTEITDRVEYKRKLERQNERLDEFAGIVSHDLRSPLNVANGRLELAREECDSDHLADVNDMLARMEEIIDDTLTLAKQGQTVGETEPVDLSELATQCWERVATADATVAVADDLTIHGDPDRIRHILENLFRNAVDHGGGTVHVRVEPDEAGGFYVADDGPGIPADERAHVFETGYSTADDNTGFGLGIVETIVEAHGWEIDVTESDDGGSRFEITGVDVA